MALKAEFMQHGTNNPDEPELRVWIRVFWFISHHQQTCLLMSAPAWLSHTTQWGCPPNAAVCAGVRLKRLLTVFTSQPICTRCTTHSSWWADNREITRDT